MNTFNKLSLAASVLLVLLVVVLTNRVDNANFSKLKYSVTTIYEDRIIASDLIFKMSMRVNEKKEALLTSDSLFFNDRNNACNNDIEGFITSYELTKLTDEELEIFNRLKSKLNNLTELEKNYLNTDTSDSSALLKKLNEIDDVLFRLSNIQLKEARAQLLISNKVTENFNLFKQSEIVFLIFTAILLQFIIFYKRKRG